MAVGNMGSKQRKVEITGINADNKKEGHEYTSNLRVSLLDAMTTAITESALREPIEIRITILDIPPPMHLG